MIGRVGKTKWHPPVDHSEVFKMFTGNVRDSFDKTMKAVTLSGYQAHMTTQAFMDWEQYCQRFIHTDYKANPRIWWETFTNCHDRIRKPDLLTWWKMQKREACKLFRLDAERGWIDVTNGEPELKPIPENYVHLTGRDLEHTQFMGSVTELLTPKDGKKWLVNYYGHTMRLTDPQLTDWEIFVKNWFDANKGKKFVDLPETKNFKHG
jgi:hypothetical protein